jgi:hypothetical protein
LPSGVSQADELQARTDAFADLSLKFIAVQFVMT